MGNISSSRRLDDDTSIDIVLPFHNESGAVISQKSRTTLLALASGVLALRLLALYGIGPLNHPLYPDEGSYLSAAALWARGFVPHRDFLLAHPPATTYFLAPFTLISPPSGALVAARTVMCVIGAMNAWLIGTIGRRFAPMWAAATGMMVYAVLPEAVLADQKVVIEPLLNCACLIVAFLWLRQRPPDESRMSKGAWTAGAFLGIALAFKFWAVFLIVPLFATTVAGRRVKDVARIVLASSCSWLLITIPLAFRAPSDFYRQVIVFQSNRVDGSPTTVAGRFLRVFADPRVLPRGRTVVETTVIALAIVLVISKVQTTRESRFSLVWLATTATVFIASPLHFSAYNAHLAPSVSLSAIWVVSAFAPGGARRVFDGAPAWKDRLVARPIARYAPLVVVALVCVQGGISSLRNVATKSPDAPQIAAIVKGLPKCTTSTTATWLIAGDRYPNPDVGGSAVTDPYSTAIIAATMSGHGTELFDAPAAQKVIRQLVDACPTVIVSPERFLLGDQERWFEANFHRIAHTGPNGPEVWRRNSAS